MGAALYIVGNGFDLHHGIAPLYKAFGEYLKSNARSSYRVVKQYFDVDEQFWADFETRQFWPISKGRRR